MVLKRGYSTPVVSASGLPPTLSPPFRSRIPTLPCPVGATSDTKGSLCIKRAPSVASSWSAYLRGTLSLCCAHMPTEAVARYSLKQCQTASVHYALRRSSSSSLLTSNFLCCSPLKHYQIKPETFYSQRKLLKVPPVSPDLAVPKSGDFYRSWRRSLRQTDFGVQKAPIKKSIGVAPNALEIQIFESQHECFLELLKYP